MPTKVRTYRKASEIVRAVIDKNKGAPWPKNRANAINISDRPKLADLKPTLSRKKRRVAKIKQLRKDLEGQMDDTRLFKKIKVENKIYNKHVRVHGDPPVTPAPKVRTKKKATTKKELLKRKAKSSRQYKEDLKKASRKIRERQETYLGDRRRHKKRVKLNMPSTKDKLYAARQRYAWSRSKNA